MVEDHEHDKGCSAREVEEVALIEQVNAEKGASFDTRGAFAGIENRASVEILLGRDREGECRDSEEKSANSERGNGGECSDRCGDERGEDDRPTLGHPDQFELKEAGIAEANIHREAAVQMKRKQATKAGVGHLGERQLAGPSGDDRDRCGAKRKDHDGRIQEEPRRGHVELDLEHAGNEEGRLVPRQEEGDHEREAGGQPRQAADPPDPTQMVRHGPNLGRERHRTFVGRTALPIDGDDDGDKEDEAAQADL